MIFFSDIILLRQSYAMRSNSGPDALFLIRFCRASLVLISPLVLVLILRSLSHAATTISKAMGKRLMDQKAGLLHAGADAMDQLGLMVLPIIKMSDSVDSGSVAMTVEAFAFDELPLSATLLSVKASSTFIGTLSVIRVTYCSFFESKTVNRKVGS